VTIVTFKIYLQFIINNPQTQSSTKALKSGEWSDGETVALDYAGRSPNLQYSEF